MPNEGLQLRASAKVTITRIDDNGNVIGVDTHDVDLTREEAEALWHLQQQG